MFYINEIAVTMHKLFINAMAFIPKVINSVASNAALHN